MTIPRFTAEASLYDASGHYRSRQSAVPAPGLVLPAWCAGIMCEKNEEGYFECECIDEVWE
jgi:hypothetical protein